jgi:diacylglycerol kinase family enzyme
VPSQERSGSGSPGSTRQRRDATNARRLPAAGALLALGAALLLTAVTVVRQAPRGLVVAGLLVLGIVALAVVLRRQGMARKVAAAVAAGSLVAAVVVVLTGGVILEGLFAALLLCVALLAGRTAMSVHVELPAAPRPNRPVVVWNPRSGGGKAVTHHLADEARARSIEPLELRPGDDLDRLVRDAVAAGADGLAAAGGDGTQALVAAIAAEHDLPFACIPAGTRNHFALDLGVDRTDVVGALDAFVSGGERRVDLAEVNGRVFVNNVSFGLYAAAVQRASYRDAKLRTVLETAPEVIGRQAAQQVDLRWTGPDGSGGRTASVILVSNNRYRLGRPIGSGTRPRLDEGCLGIAVLSGAGRETAGGGRPRRWHQWTASSFELDSAGPVPAGVDGEALVLAAPVRLQVRPGALRVRIAPHHPGASPSAAQPDTFRGTLQLLAAMAAGRGDVTSLGPAPR